MGQRVEAPQAPPIERPDFEIAPRVGLAISAGVFGVPTVLVGEELFWGDDHLAAVAEALSV